MNATSGPCPANLPEKEWFPKWLKPFETGADPWFLATNFSMARMFFGAIVVYRYLDIFGFSVLSPEPGRVSSAAGLAVILGMMTLFGFLTPIALLGLAVFFVRPPFSSTLGDQVALILVWVLLISGSGRFYSVDSRLLKVKGMGHLFQPFYKWTSVPLTGPNSAKLRFLAFCLFASISLSAMVFHFGDPFWLKGEVLQLLLVTPYINDFHQFFASIRSAFPLTYDLMCRLGLFFQAAAEILLLPLMAFRWGRTFLLIQFTAFFLASNFIMNLGYLPLIELVFWMVLFHYPATFGATDQGDLAFHRGSRLESVLVRWLPWLDWYGRVARVQCVSEGEIEAGKPGLVFSWKGSEFVGFDAVVAMSRRCFPLVVFWPVLQIIKVTKLRLVVQAQERKKILRFGARALPGSGSDGSSGQFPLNLFLKVSILVVLVFSVDNVFRVWSGTSGTWSGRAQKILRLGYRSFAQEPVNVFNRPDLLLGSTHIVIYEVDGDNNWLRTVPFMDIDGGRLAYLKNDYLYFQWSLRWQRTAFEKRFRKSDQGYVPSPFTEFLVERVILLDHHLVDAEQTKRYQVYFFRREMEDGFRAPIWGAAHPFASMEYVSYPAFLKTDLWVFNLPPGHYLERHRLNLTSKAFQRISEP